MTLSIETLQVKRQLWIDAVKENNFEGVRKLLTELYPDNAHFIYELLQNAEDAQANKVTFELSHNEIKFRHNGKKLFDLQDIESITSIGSSTKRDDHTSIGKFGVGFKAVFAYTDTPEIHSGEYHFAIHELVLPVTDNVKNIQLDSEETLFIFPFNSSNKTPEQAVKEITKGLLSLNDNTLLFLSNIKQIDFILPDKSQGRLKFDKLPDEYVKIEKIQPQKQDVGITYWLLYENNVEINDEGKTKNCRIAIAYNVKKELNKKSKKEYWAINPLDHGQVSIFFPAEKETSKLRFHIHAPFASTVARDSVRDCEANNMLFEKIAELVVKSLDHIKEKGLLTISFLAVLPIKEDTLTATYEPIRKSIINAFQESSLTPVRSGGHEPSNLLYQGPAKIFNFLNDDGLKFFTNYNNVSWVANASQKNSREDRFIESLEIDYWGEKEFVQAISDYSYHKCDELYEFITSKKDNELFQLYAILGDYLEKNYFLPKINTELKIIRAEKNSEDIHLPPCEVFLNSDYNAHNLEIYFVKKSMYIKNEEIQQNIIKFFEKIGVKELNEESIIENIIDKYSEPKNENRDSHFEDLRKIVDFLFKREYNKLFYKISKVRFILGESEDNLLYWCTPNSIFVDMNNFETGLSNFINIHHKLKLCSLYNNEFSEKYILDTFIPFLKKLGLMDSLVIIESPLYYNPKFSALQKVHYSTRETHTRTSKDWTIDNIDDYIKIKDKLASKLLWNALLHGKNEHAQALYSPNQSHPINVEDSLLINTLKNEAWIPNKDGMFCKPEEMSRNDLLDDFIYDNTNGLLDAIGFAFNVKMQHEKETSSENDYDKLKKDALRLGFETVDDLEEAATLAKELKCEGLTIRELRQERKKTKQQKPFFPEKDVHDFERRQEHLNVQYSKAPDVSSETRERKVRTSNYASKSNAEQWLREHYTNDDGIMVCQICKYEMPFKKKDGKHYFEKIEILSSAHISKEHEAKYLALCPICAAKYKYFIKKDNNLMEDVAENIINAEPDIREISIALGDEFTTIRFVQAHILDIKTIIELY